MFRVKVRNRLLDTHPEKDKEMKKQRERAEAQVKDASQQKGAHFLCTTA